MAQQYLPANARERIQDLMTEHKITQNELAKASGCNESTLSRFLTGKTDKLSDENIIAIACAFNVTTDFLLGLTDVPDRTNSDLAELGLSVETGKTLYASKRASTVINAMVESKSFPALVELIHGGNIGRKGMPRRTSSTPCLRRWQRAKTAKRQLSFAAKGRRFIRRMLPISRSCSRMYCQKCDRITRRRSPRRKS